MSFAPPSPSGPQQNPSPLGPPTGHPGTPRSTPIPGFEAPSSIPGNAGSSAPPRPTDFVNGVVGSPMGYQTPGDAPPPISKQGRSWAAMIFVFLLFAGPVVGLGIGAWAFLRGRETADQADQAIEDAQQTVDSLLQQAQQEIDSISVPVIVVPDTVPGLSLPTATVDPAVVPVETAPPVTAPPLVSLFADGGAPGVMGAFEGAISGEPTRFMQIILYPEYAFATAQDANIPDHVDEYPWRDGVVGPSSPVTLVGDGELEANLFSAPEVDWTFISRAVAEAPGLTTAGLTTVEAGTVSHIIVERSVFTPDFAVVVRVYVTGPRGSAYVEYTPAGVMTQVVQ
jgi:hypothetical protein